MKGSPEPQKAATMNGKRKIWMHESRRGDHQISPSDCKTFKVTRIIQFSKAITSSKNNPDLMTPGGRRRACVG
jgi:hypothetical protein